MYICVYKCVYNYTHINTHTHTHTYTYTHYIYYKVDNQEGATIQHGEIVSIYCNNL